MKIMPIVNLKWSDSPLKLNEPISTSLVDRLSGVSAASGPSGIGRYA
jgi:hypothetical protein